MCSRTYRITPIQHPERGCAFEGIYLSRLPLAPPLILQFDCWDARGELITPYVCRSGDIRKGTPAHRHDSHDEIPFLVCHLTLQTSEGDEASWVVAPDNATVSMLYGSLVATPTQMLDYDGAQGIYFAFPDVSVRFVGRFRLKANILRITGYVECSSGSGLGSDKHSGQPLNTCYSDIFEVVTNVDYVAPGQLCSS